MIRSYNNSIFVLLVGFLVVLFYGNSNNNNNNNFVVLAFSGTTISSYFNNNNNNNNLKSMTTNNNLKTNVIVGSTGYIGKACVKESIRQGYNTIALVRDVDKVVNEKKDLYGPYFDGICEIIQCDVEDINNVNKILKDITNEYGKIESIISCMAASSGLKKDVYKIDYQATLNCLHAGQSVNAKHFVLLSAYCVQKPLLQLQKAKLKMEAELTSQDNMTYSIVRPTAYFKSLTRQVDNIVKKGSAYMLFGNGKLNRYNPISERDLATYMINTISDETKHNRILNIGGPTNTYPDGSVGITGITQKQQAQWLFQLTNQKEKYIHIPENLFNILINTIQPIATLFKSETLDDVVELIRIGRYYACEDMLTIVDDEKFGTDTLIDHYKAIIEQDGYRTIDDNVESASEMVLGLLGASAGGGSGGSE